MEFAALALAGLAALAGWWWLTRQRPPADAEQRLRQICLGDRPQAERLVDAEMARTPGITRTEAVERAVARHQRDNR